MQRLFIFGFILLLMNSGFSQSKSMTVPFVSYWALGDTYNFKVSKINEQWKEDKLIKIDTTAYLANFEVIDSTENSYKIKWSFQTQLVNNIELSDRVLEKLAKYQMTHVIYRTSSLGQRLPSIIAPVGRTDSPATARCMASMVACRIFRRSISSTEAEATNQPNHRRPAVSAAHE